MHPWLWKPEEADLLSQSVLFLLSHFPTINPHFRFHCLGWIKKFNLAFLVVSFPDCLHEGKTSAFLWKHMTF